MNITAMPMEITMRITKMIIATSMPWFWLLPAMSVVLWLERTNEGEGIDLLDGREWPDERDSAKCNRRSAHGRKRRSNRRNLEFRQGVAKNQRKKRPFRPPPRRLPKPIPPVDETQRVTRVS